MSMVWMVVRVLLDYKRSTSKDDQAQRQLKDETYRKEMAQTGFTELARSGDSKLAQQTRIMFDVFQANNMSATGAAKKATQFFMDNTIEISGGSYGTSGKTWFSGSSTNKIKGRISKNAIMLDPSDTSTLEAGQKAVNEHFQAVIQANPHLSPAHWSIHEAPNDMIQIRHSTSGSSKLLSMRDLRQAYQMEKAKLL